MTRALCEYGVSTEDLSTDDLVTVLAGWDKDYRISVSVESGGVLVAFDSIPEPLDSLLREVLDLCPDMGEDPDGVRQSLTRDKAITLWWD